MVPARGPVADELGDLASVRELDFAPLMLPGGAAGAVGALAPAAAGGPRLSRPDSPRAPRSRPDRQLDAARPADRRPAGAGARRGLRGRDPSRARGREPRAPPGGHGLIALTGRAASAVIASSRTVAAQFPASVQAKVTVMYPPIPANHAGGDAAGFRRRHGIGPDEPCILAVGNLTPGRGQDVLLRSLPSIRSEVEGARLVLVGPTFDRPKDIAFEAELRALATGARCFHRRDLRRLRARHGRRLRGGRGGREPVPHSPGVLRDRGLRGARRGAPGGGDAGRRRARGARRCPGRRAGPARRPGLARESQWSRRSRMPRRPAALSRAARRSPSAFLRSEAWRRFSGSSGDRADPGGTGV